MAAKARPKHGRVYLRVLCREREDRPEDPALLEALIERFAADPERAYVSLLMEPDPHPRGGWCLQLDLKQDDSLPLIQFLADEGWMNAF